MPTSLIEQALERPGSMSRRRLVCSLILTACLVVAALMLSEMPHNFSPEAVVQPQPTARLSSNITLIVKPEWIDVFTLVGIGNATPIAADVPYMRRWTVHPHLAVTAVLADDQPMRRYMRHAVRKTWGSYPGVARRSNDFDGLLLLLFAYSLNWAQAPFISDAVAAEMEENEDVVQLLLTSVKGKERAAGVNGDFGLEFQRFNVRKMLILFRYLYNAFPDVPFLSKTDDDTFIYVPEFMRTIRQLPRINVAYGRVYRHPHQPTYILGPHYLYSRDVIGDAITERTCVRMASMPYDHTLRAVYRDGFSLGNEDITLDWAVAMRYGRAKSPERPFPGYPREQPELPPVSGWGRAYMAYVQSSMTTPRSGTTATPDGRGVLRYCLPTPKVFKPGNMIYIGDNCRVMRIVHRAQTGMYGNVAQHRVIGLEQSELVATELAAREAAGTILQPTEALFAFDPYHKHAYLLFYRGTGHCEAVLRDDPDDRGLLNAPYA